MKSNAAPKILLTGASGNYGGKVLQFLLNKVDASEVAALARNTASLAEQAQKGVDVRQGDYHNYQSLLEAFRGIETLLLVSAEAFTDRQTQQSTALDAAQTAGVKRIIYTSIQKKTGSTNKIPMVTEINDITEEVIFKSGMQYTILRNSLYLDALLSSLGNDYLNTGIIRLPGGTTKTALASSIDMAEGAANLLLRDEPGNKIYTIGASEAFSMDDVASALSDACGNKIQYVQISREQFVQDKVAAGLPVPVAEFLAEWLVAIEDGEFSEVTKDLEHLIGRAPTNYHEYIVSSARASVG